MATKTKKTDIFKNTNRVEGEAKQTKEHSKLYHCDGYYFNGTCPSVGIQDAADVRMDKNGVARKHRNTCKTNGLSPILARHGADVMSFPLCPHCIENRTRKGTSHRRNSTTIDATPFKVVSPITNVTVRAFTNAEDMNNYLNDHKELVAKG